MRTKQKEEQRSKDEKLQPNMFVQSVSLYKCVCDFLQLFKLIIITYKKKHYTYSTYSTSTFNARKNIEHGVSQVTSLFATFSNAQYTELVFIVLSSYSPYIIFWHSFSLSSPNLRRTIFRNFLFFEEREGGGEMCGYVLYVHFKLER